MDINIVKKEEKQTKKRQIALKDETKQAFENDDGSSRKIREISVRNPPSTSHNLQDKTSRVSVPQDQDKTKDEVREEDYIENDQTIGFGAPLKGAVKPESHARAREQVTQTRAQYAAPTSSQAYNMTATTMHGGPTETK